MFDLDGNNNGKILDRSRVLETINRDYAPDPIEEDVDDYEVPSIKTSLPDDAAQSGAQEPPVSASPASVEPPPAPQFDYQAELREQRNLVNTLIQRDQEREAYYRQQAQPQQQPDPAPQYEPDQYLQWQNVAPHLQQINQLHGGVQHVYNELIEIKKIEAKRELDSTLSSFRARAEEFPDFDKYVKSEAVQQAIVGVQAEIARGKKMNVNWSQLLEQEYRQNSYDDLRNQVKTRATEEAKRADHAKKLADVGGTPRGGTYQAPATPPSAAGSRMGEPGHRSRIVDFIRNFGA